MSLPVEFYVYVGYGLFAMIAVSMIISYLLGGFLGPFMKVKRSRGKMVLVRVRTPIQDYFRAGVVSDGFLVYKNILKITKRIPMKPGVVSRAATVFWVEVDDERNCFFDRRDGSAVEAVDAEKTDSLYVRALYRPTLLGDGMIFKATLLLVIVVLIAVLAIGYMTYKNGQNVNLILEALHGAAKATTTGGVIN